jgi:glycosyltransferase involved in cell wall biosynthesis
MRGLRIVQVVNTLAHSDGGPARNSFELNLALNDQPGVKAGLVSVHGAKDTVVNDHVERGGHLPSMSPRRLALKAGGDLITPAAFVRLARGSDAVLIHGYFLPWVPVVAAIATCMKKPVFVMPHGALTPHELGKKRGKKWIFMVLSAFILRGRRVTLVTGSETECEDIRAMYPKLRVRWAGVGTRVPALREVERGLSPIPRLLTMSRIATKKRIDLAIGAVAELAARGRHVTLDVCGTGPMEMETSLVELSARLGVRDQVRFRGLVTGEEKEEMLLAADIFLLPSEDENFGIGVAEAAAHGLPIVASRNVAAAKLLSSRVVNLLDELSSTALADGVTHWLDNFASGVRGTAIEEARHSYSWTSVSSRWLTIINEPAA